MSDPKCILINVIAWVGFVFWVALFVGFAAMCLTPVIKDLLERMSK